MTDSRDVQLRLRAIEPEDVDFMYDIENDPDLWFYSDRVAPLSRRALFDYAMTYDADPFRAGQLRLIAEFADSHEPCAILDLYEIDAMNSRAYVGYVVAPRFRGRKLGSKTLAMLAEYAKNHLRLSELVARTPCGNAAGMAVMKACGFVVEAVLTDWLNHDGKREDMAIMRLRLH